MYYEPSEIVDLLIAVFVGPVMWVGLRDLRLAGKAFLMAGYSATVTAYVVTILEQAPPFPLFPLFNTLEHVSLGVAGVLFAAAALAIWRDMRQGVGLQ